MRSRFGIVALGLLIAAPAFAQAGGNDAAAAARKTFDEVAGNVTKTAELVPAEKYNYRPNEAVRTFAQQIAHIADSHNYYCAQVGGKKVEWSDPVEKGSLEKTALMRKLGESIAACKAAYGAGGQFGPMIENVGHTNLHYGNLITYVRMLGMKPPSS